MTEHDLDLLLTPDGRQLLAELREEALGDELRVLTRYRTRYAPELVRAALTLTKLRVRARAKFSRADEMYFTAAGFEQASTEAMARHSAKRFAPFDHMADLCSGIGGDLIALAEHRPVTAVDLDPLHLRMGMLNAGVYGVADNVTPVQFDVRAVALDSMPAAFIDPARRTDARRMKTGESEPPLDWCFSLAAGGIAVGIKAAPGLPTDLVPDGWELEFVSERRELKASLIWSPSLATTRRRATLLPGDQTLVDAPGSRLDVRDPGTYLLDPDPAVTRAGLVAELGLAIANDGVECWQLDQRIAFLSSNLPMETPFGRLLRIEASLPWNLAKLRDTLRALDIGVVDIRKRGSPVDVEEVQRKLKPKGSRSATVALTWVADKPWALVCTTP